ncbi:MAG: siderophore-interacting protein [Acidimicrobiales bacterium]
MPNANAVEALPTPRTWLVQVVHSHMITPRARRLVLGAPDLADFPNLGADQFAYLLLPPAGRTELTVDTGFQWSDVRAMPRHQRPRGAYYSLRHVRPAQGEIDLDIVMHDGGRASDWATDARVGDPAALWGPRVLFRPPDDVDWFVLMADDTGVPAMLSILDHLPADRPVIALAQVADADEIRPVTPRPHLDLRWFCPLDPGPSLAEALASLTLPEGTGYAWGGGERGWIQLLDRILADDHGLAASQRSLTGYWRHGVATSLR